MDNEKIKSAFRKTRTKPPKLGLEMLRILQEERDSLIDEAREIMNNIGSGTKIYDFLKEISKLKKTGEE